MYHFKVVSRRDHLTPNMRVKSSLCSFFIFFFIFSKLMKIFFEKWCIVKRNASLLEAYLIKIKSKKMFPHFQVLFSQGDHFTILSCAY